MSTQNYTAEIVICGAGIAGISAAYFLAVKNRIPNIILVDENSPLSLTSNHSTECYRNWWPDPAMVELMNHSIDLLEDLASKSNNTFHLNRRGYLYCTGKSEKIQEIISAAESISTMGAGQLRIHSGNASDPKYVQANMRGFHDTPGGADLLLEPDLIQHYFPGLSINTKAALHVRRAGWLSAQQLGMYMLYEARLKGVTFLQGHISSVETSGGKIHSVYLENGRKITTPLFINASGPFLNDVSHLMGIELPVYHELHLKVALNDPSGFVKRDSPLLIWNDPQLLVWSAEEATELSEENNLGWTFNLLPAGVHTRPEGETGSQMILILWEYLEHRKDIRFPIPIDPFYPEIALRGLSTMLPAMRSYIGKFTRPHVDGGYYTKTRENRPLIGKCHVDGSYMIGALSGFGIMASCASGDLLADIITGNQLPSYAPAFSLDRYANPDYQNQMKNWVESGQL